MIDVINLQMLTTKAGSELTMIKPQMTEVAIEGMDARMLD